MAAMAARNHPNKLDLSNMSPAGENTDGEDTNILPLSLTSNGEEAKGAHSDNAAGDEIRWRICELSGCLTLFAVALVVEFVAIPHYAGVIPVQAIDIRGEDDGNGNVVC